MGSDGSALGALRMILKPSDPAFLGATLRPPQRLVLLALVVHADQAGQCWPSLTAIAKGTGLDRRTVMRALNRLESLGLVDREQRSLPDPTLYTITLMNRGTRPLSPHRWGQSAPRGVVTLGAESHRDRGTVTHELPIELNRRQEEGIGEIRVRAHAREGQLASDVERVDL